MAFTAVSDSFYAIGQKNLSHLQLSIQHKAFISEEMYLELELVVLHDDLGGDAD